MCTIDSVEFTGIVYDTRFLCTNTSEIILSYPSSFIFTGYLKNQLNNDNKTCIYYISCQDIIEYILKYLHIELEIFNKNYIILYSKNIVGIQNHLKFILPKLEKLQTKTCVKECNSCNISHLCNDTTVPPYLKILELNSEIIINNDNTTLNFFLVPQKYKILACIDNDISNEVISNSNNISNNKIKQNIKPYIELENINILLEIKLCDAMKNSKDIFQVDEEIFAQQHVENTLQDLLELCSNLWIFLDIYTIIETFHLQSSYNTELVIKHITILDACAKNLLEEAFNRAPISVLQFIQYIRDNSTNLTAMYGITENDISIRLDKWLQNASLLCALYSTIIHPLKEFFTICLKYPTDIIRNTAKISTNFINDTCDTSIDYFENDTKDTLKTQIDSSEGNVKSHIDSPPDSNIKAQIDLSGDFLNSSKPSPLSQSSSSSSIHLERIEYLLKILQNLLQKCLPEKINIDSNIKYSKESMILFLLYNNTKPISIQKPSSITNNIIKILQYKLNTFLDTVLKYKEESSSKNIIIIPTVEMIEKHQQCKQQKDIWENQNNDIVYIQESINSINNETNIQHLLFRCLNPYILTSHNKPIILPCIMNNNTIKELESNFILITAPKSTSLLPISKCEYINDSNESLTINETIDSNNTITQDSLYIFEQLYTDIADFFTNTCSIKKLQHSVQNSINHMLILNIINIYIQDSIYNICQKILYPNSSYIEKRSPILYQYLFQNCLCDMKIIQDNNNNNNIQNIKNDNIKNNIPLHVLITPYHRNNSIQYITDIISSTLQDSLHMHVYFCIPQQFSLLNDAAITSQEDKSILTYLLYNFTDLCNILLRSYDILQSNIIQMVVDTIIHSYLSNIHDNTNNTTVKRSNFLFNNSFTTNNNISSDTTNNIPNTTSLAPSELYTAPPNELYSIDACTIIDFTKYQNSFFLRTIIRNILAQIFHIHNIPCEFGTFSTLYSSSPQEILLDIPTKYIITNENIQDLEYNMFARVQHIINTFLQRLPILSNSNTLLLSPLTNTIPPMYMPSSDLESEIPTFSDNLGSTVDTSSTNDILQRLEKLDRPTLLLEVQQMGTFFYYLYLYTNNIL